MAKPHKKILIIDDDLRLDKMLVLMFEGHGLATEFAASGSHALEILTQFRPDAIILDLMMPGMDGFEVCERIKKDTALKDIPVIVLTALPADVHKERALSLGACAYIEKPFVSAKLLDKIKEVMGEF